MRRTTFKYQEFKARYSLQSRSYQLVITILSSFTVLYCMNSQPLQLTTLTIWLAKENTAFLEI